MDGGGHRIGILWEFLSGFTPMDSFRPAAAPIAKGNSVQTLTRLIGDAFGGWLRDGALTWAAALAFTTTVSLAPLVTLCLAVAGMFSSEPALREEILQQTESLVGPAGAEVVRGILANARANHPDLAGLISLAVLFVAASAVFLQLRAALDAMWNVAPRRDLPWSHEITSRLTAMVAALALGLLLLGITASRALLPTGLAFALAPAGFAVMAAVFASLFKLLPDARIAWRDAAVGGVVTAALFEIGRLLIGLYLGKTAAGSAYGASGSLIAVLLWIYYSAAIVLLGAEFAQVWARQRGRAIRPKTSAVPVPVLP